MEKSIKDILIKNHLYNGNDNEIYINMKNDFLNNYKLNNTNIHEIKNSIKKNKDGYYLFNDTPYIISDIITDGHNKSFWVLLDNGSKILFKSVSDEEIDMELLFEEYARNLNIKNAKYNVGILNNEKYLISNSFLANDECLVDYYYTKSKTIIDIEQLVKKAKEINQEKHLKKVLLLDILAKNYDRFPHNFNIIYKNKKFYETPLYDNGLSCITEKNKKSIIAPAYKYDCSDEALLEYILKDIEIKNWCYTFVFNNINIKDNIYNKKNIIINNKNNMIFIDSIESGKDKIKKIIKANY